MANTFPFRRYRFTRAQRLHGSRAFAAVYGARMRKTIGPLVVHARSNDLGYPRLGLSVGRKVGPAVARNRVKRLLREAFRLLQHDFPHGYDIVVGVRPHAIATLADYQRMLFAALRDLHARRQRQNPTSG